MFFNRPRACLHGVRDRGLVGSGGHKTRETLNRSVIFQDRWDGEGEGSQLFSKRENRLRFFEHKTNCC